MQHYDGDVEEYALAEWRDLDIELTDTTGEDWAEPLEENLPPEK